MRKKYFDEHDTTSKLYRAWKHMKDRCYRAKCNNYKDYGGRGIVVCDEWKNDFSAFRDWALANGYDKDLTLDRIDFNGNYEPSNCRWATKLVQSNNRRGLRWITYKGETKTLTGWSNITGIPWTTLHMRLTAYGWSVEMAIETPVGKKVTHCE